MSEQALRYREIETYDLAARPPEIQDSVRGETLQSWICTPSSVMRADTFKRTVLLAHK